MIKIIKPSLPKKLNIFTIWNSQFATNATKLNFGPFFQVQEIEWNMPTWSNKEEK